MEKILYDSRITNEELCAVRESFTEDTADEELYDICRDSKDADLERLIDDLNYLEEKEGWTSYVIKGKRVTHPYYAAYIGKGGAYYPVYVDSIEDALRKCFDTDAYDVIVSDNNGSLRVQTMDHDGCCFFRIYVIKNKRYHNINYLKEVR